MTTGGFGWIQNLIDIDHYFILPFLFGLSNLAILEVCIEIFIIINLHNININIIFQINQILFHVKDSKFSRIYKNFCRVLIIGFVPLMACLPSVCYIIYKMNNLLFSNIYYIKSQIKYFSVYHCFGSPIIAVQ